MNYDLGTVRESPMAILLRGIPDGNDERRRMTLQMKLKRDDVDGAVKLLSLVEMGRLAMREEDETVLRKVCKMNLLPSGLRFYRATLGRTFSSLEFGEWMLPHLEQFETQYQT